MKKISVLFLLLNLMLSCTNENLVLLRNGKEIPVITVLGPENPPLKYAAEDLISDLEKIAGNKTEQTLSNKIIIGKIEDIDFEAENDFKELKYLESQLKGKWESYRVFEKNGNLYIIGSDTRGTMWGIYKFTEEYLGIDPMYLWSDKTPETKEHLVLRKVKLESDGPFFKFRGCFVNDEDFLTEWKQFEGKRNNDYKYYFKIMHPQASDQVIETVLRLRMNMLIPSSFNDVLNPPEEYAIRKASERGLFVTMHHIEPLGVGGFNFDDYFKKQGREAPLFSYLKNPDDLKEVWEAYVKAWSAYPGVIWQLGLRGRGDRSMWDHDPSIPQNDSIRGKIISDAIQFQYDLVRKYDPDGLMTLTLWAEMAGLMKKGVIKIPADIGVIFSDNSPGWGYRSDFYDVKRESGRDYGIYYHHQLWGSGPHFIQGIPISKTYQVVKEAVENNSSQYCMLNIGNVREFIYGMKLSAELLFSYNDFNPDIAAGKWFSFYYGDFATEAGSIYEKFFGHYRLQSGGNSKEPGIVNPPFLLDGHLAGRMKSMLVDLNRSFGLEEFTSEHWVTAAEFSTPQPLKWAEGQENIQREIGLQKEKLTTVVLEADKLLEKMEGYPAYFFDVNLRTPAKMLLGLNLCTHETMSAVKEEFNGNRGKSIEHLKSALAAVREANRIKKSMLQGKWEHWYRGEYKIRFSSYEEYLSYLIENIGDGKKQQ